jgi:hypothetical protein
LFRLETQVAGYSCGCLATFKYRGYHKI